MLYALVSMSEPTMHAKLKLMYNMTLCTSPVINRKISLLTWAHFRLPNKAIELIVAENTNEYRMQGLIQEGRRGPQGF